MSVLSSGRRSQFPVALILSGLLLLGGAASGVAVGTDLGPRRTMLALTNEDRAVHDRRNLDFADRLARYAKEHSEAMARKGYLFHSSEQQLRDALEGYRWEIGGENVGVGGSLESLEDAFMASKLHRENILREEFRHAAIGITREGDRIWITVIFYG
jgi:uncharacterized protein YkwD